MKKAILSLLSCVPLLALTACGTGMNTEIDQNGRYWERADTTDAIFQQGPKAQQMLFQDIARCVSTINEMQRLGAIKNAIPAETFNAGAEKDSVDAANNRLAKYDTPEREGYMRTEYYDYTDFETCMSDKGWQRIKYINYEVASKARTDYLETIGYERYRSKMMELTPEGPYNQ